MFAVGENYLNYHTVMRANFLNFHSVILHYGNTLKNAQTIMFPLRFALGILFVKLFFSFLHSANSTFLRNFATPQFQIMATLNPSSWPIIDIMRRIFFANFHAQSSKIIIIGKFTYCFEDVKNKSKIDLSHQELHPKKEKKSTKKNFSWNYK